MNLPQTLKNNIIYEMIRNGYHRIVRNRRIQKHYSENSLLWGEDYAAIERTYARNAGNMGTGEGYSAWEAKEKYLLSWFRRELVTVIQKYRDEPLQDNSESPRIPPIIWIYWWDGFDNAPPIVKACVSSTLRHSGTLQVRLIDCHNLGDYISMPAFLEKKQAEGKMGKAHFSDIVRMMLLSQYGGFWMDATLFCSRTIPEETITDRPFYTCKKQWNSGTPSHGLWSGWMIGGVPGFRFFRFMADALTAYWASHDQAIDYLMMDYLFQIAYNEFPELKSAVDNLPPQNTARDELMARINEAYTPDLFENDTFVYKLSYRYGKPTERTADGQPTFYAYLLHGDELSK